MRHRIDEGRIQQGCASCRLAVVLRCRLGRDRRVRGCGGSLRDPCSSRDGRHLNYLLTYVITPCSTVLFEKLTGSQLVKKWNLNVHYRIHKCPPPVPFLSQLYPVHTPHPTSSRSILILSSHLRLGLPSCHFPSGFPIITLYTPLFSTIRATWPPISFFSI